MWRRFGGAAYATLTLFVFTGQAIALVLLTWAFIFDRLGVGPKGIVMHEALALAVAATALAVMILTAYTLAYQAVSAARQLREQHEVALWRDGWVKVPYPDDGRPFGDGAFPTPSGRVELVNERMAAMGQPVLPDYRPAREGAGGDASLLERFPLQLMTAKWHTRFLNSSYSHLPKHGPAEGGPFVELSGPDAAARGLASPSRCRRAARCDRRMPPRAGRRSH